MEIEKIKFQIETARILEILSREIYDSPYALLRENVQNAYDAILMRITKENLKYDDGLIIVNIQGNQIEVVDNGIGMTEKELRENFWQKGSSGKRTPLALASGVIGTFGIGALANFGVCSKLSVETRSADSQETLISTAERDKLRISEPCIELDRHKDNRSPGTKIVATLDDSSRITLNETINYLGPFIKYLPVKVLINGVGLSQKHYRDELLPDKNDSFMLPKVSKSDSDYKVSLEILVDKKNFRVYVILNDVNYKGERILGDAVLSQNSGVLMGLRNYFGLAPIPVSGIYRFGGIANLSILSPTAGREALSRESIEHAHRIITLVEDEVSEQISKTEYADKSVQFMQYVVSSNRYQLGSRIAIEVKPDEKQVELGKIQGYCQSRKTHYYTGTDPSTIRAYGSEEENCLLLLSQSNPRRQIQYYYITSVFKIEEAPDKPTITKKYNKSELTIEELGLTIRIATTMDQFYLISNVEIIFVEVTHGVNFLVEKRGEVIYIYIKRDASAIKPLIACYKTAYEVIDGLVNDFVRVYLYPRFADYVPSSTREGAEALSRLLKKNRELYKYDYNDVGPIDKLITDFASGKIDWPGVLRESKTLVRAQSQVVTKTQIGRLETEIPTLTQAQAPEESLQESTAQPVFGAMPSILRLESELQSKILRTTNRYPALNNFQMFLGLSDRLFKTDYDFFLVPHTTKIIWGAYRIIFFFTHASSLITLYYDIELKDYIKGDSAGGSSFPTVTIVTKNRIYVPIPEQLTASFEITQGDEKEFYVRYDIV